MVKPSADDIKKEVEEQDDEVYGDESFGGHAADLESDDDVDKIREAYMGDKLKENEELDLASEIVADEDAVRKGSANPVDESGSSSSAIGDDDDDSDDDEDTPEVPLEDADKS